MTQILDQLHRHDAARDDDDSDIIASFLAEVIDAAALEQGRDIRIVPFAEDGTLTSNVGFTLKFRDLKIEYQVTIVRSK